MLFLKDGIQHAFSTVRIPSEYAFAILYMNIMGGSDQRVLAKRECHEQTRVSFYAYSICLRLGNRLTPVAQ